MKSSLRGHWGNRNNKDFLYQIAFDFIAQLKKMMAAKDVTASELAARIGVSKGRVSQIMNNPGNLELMTVVDWARALGGKVGIVAYNDLDPSNDRGPINPDVFVMCWDKAGRPSDFFEARMAFASTGDPVDESLARNLRSQRMERLAVRPTRKGDTRRGMLVVRDLKSSGAVQH